MVHEDSVLREGTLILNLCKVASELDRIGWQGFCCVLDDAKALFKSPSNAAWWDAGFEDTITFLQQVSGWRLKAPAIHFSLLSHIPHPVQRPEKQ